MLSVYKKARRVVAWLGDRAEHSDLVLHKHPFMGPSKFGPIEPQVPRFGIDDLSRGLLDILFDSSNFGATDLRDKVYGTVGMAGIPTGDTIPEDGLLDTSQQVLPIDYQKTVSEVYQDVMKYLINRIRNLEVLCLHTVPPGAGPDLPTWVLDWRKPVYRVKWQHGDYCSCPWGYELDTSRIQDMRELNKLHLRGLVIGKLTNGTSQTPQRDFPTPGRGQCVPETKPLFIALYARGERSTKQASNILPAAYDYFCMEGMEGMGEKRKHGFSSDGSMFLSSVPDAAQEHDLLVAVIGYPLPLVLRPTVGDQFNFIGPLYGIGLVCSKIIMGLESRGWEFEEFTVI